MTPDQRLQIALQSEISDSTRAYLSEIQAELKRILQWSEEVIVPLQRRGELLAGGGRIVTTIKISRPPEPGNVAEEALFEALMDLASRHLPKQ